MRIPKDDAIFINGRKVCDLLWSKDEESGAPVPEIIYTPEWIRNGFALDSRLPLDECPYRFSTPRSYYEFMKAIFPYGLSDIYFFCKNASEYMGSEHTIGLMYAMPPSVRQGAIDFASDAKRDYGYRVPTLSEFQEFLLTRKDSKWADDFRFNGLFIRCDPKIYVQDKDALYLVKFHHDPCGSGLSDSRLVEQVAMDMAKDCGISVAESRISAIPGMESHMMFSRRFDRGPKGEKIHFATLNVLCGVDYDTGYQTAADFIKEEGDITDLKELWKRLLFNVLVRNVDDHWSNIGFLRAGDRWRLSPAYDIEPAPGHDKGIHAMALDVSDEGKLLCEANGEDIVDLAYKYFVPEDEAVAIHEKMKSVISQWESYADKYGMTDRDKGLAELCFSQEKDIPRPACPR